MQKKPHRRHQQFGLGLLGGLLGSLLALGCGGSSPALSSLSLSPATVTVQPGVTRQLTLSGTYGDGTTTPVTSGATFTSSSPGVAVVSTSGAVTAVSAGSTVISATASGLTASVIVTVTDSTAPPPTLASIALTPSTVSLGVSGTQALTVTGTFTDSSTAILTSSSTFVSSSTSVASVSAAGIVTGVTAGTATITATHAASGQTATVSVTVTAPAPTLASIALTPSTVSLGVSGTQALTVTGTFTDSSTANLTSGSTFVSSSTSVAAVSTAGVVTGVAAGIATITATHAASGRTATVSVTVTAPAPTLASIALTPSTVSLGVSGTQALTVTGTFTDSSTANLTSSSTFVSSSTPVATVSAAGIVTGIAAGTATITSTHSASGRTATVIVTVTAPAPTLASIALTPSPVSLGVNGTQALTVTGTYTDASTANLTSASTFASSSTPVATVSTAGVVTGVAAGTATITATHGASGRTATASVTVTAPSGGYNPSVGWNLVWADEFDGTMVDPSSWTFDIGSGGWGNGESEYYRAENAVVAGGMLTITAKVEPFGDAPYTSARMQTSQKRAFTYGKFTMRAKLPYSQAMWPAFWLLGANSSSWNLYGGTVAWPGCGEADIMEMIGGLADGSGDFTTHGALHYIGPSGRDPGPSYAYRYPQRLADDFHVYELVWTPHSFTWLFDGIAFGTKVITADMEEFTRPMFILLNLAIGGPWGGWVDTSTVFPQTYVIDYVRVYENATTAPGGSPGLATSWHLLNGPATGVIPAGETLSSAPGTASGFQPTKMVTSASTWYSPPVTGSYEAGAWSVGIFTTNPGVSSVLQAEVFKTAADGSAGVSLGSVQVDTSKTGGGNHTSWFTLTGLPVQTFSNQRIKLVLSPVSGGIATMVYNGNDFDSVITTPWSAAGP